MSSRQPTTDEWPYVRDLREGKGPLAGIEAALVHADTLGLDGAFVLACDLPLVDADAVRAVLGALASARAAAPARRGTPSVEPLCAAYRASCLPAVTRALDRGELAVYRLFEAVGGATAPLPHRVFLNVNTPADSRLAVRALERQHR